MHSTCIKINERLLLEGVGTAPTWPQSGLNPSASDRTVTSLGYVIHNDSPRLLGAELGPPVTTGTFRQDCPAMPVSVKHKTHIYCVQLTF